MGLSTTKTKSTSTATNAPSTAYKPNIDAAATTLGPAFDAATANNATLQPRINSALDYTQGVMNGDYISRNPYLQSVIDAEGRDITNGVNSQFEGAGRYGSGDYAGVLSRALLDNENKVRYADYSQERQYQNQAPGQLASIVGISSALPQAASSNYADAVRALLGQYNTQTGQGTSTQSGGVGLALLNAAAQVGAAYAGK